MWGLFYFIRIDVNVLRLEEKKITIINLKIFKQCYFYMRPLTQLLLSL